MVLEAAVLGLAFSAVSTLVVVIGAVAALRQLRYIRHGNELSALSQLRVQFESEEMLTARDFVRDSLPDAMRDPGFLAELRSVPVGPRAQHIQRVANFFEEINIYVRYGALSERMTMTIWGFQAVRYWEMMRDVIGIIRASQGSVLLYFEDFAMRAPRWIGTESNSRRRMLGALSRDPSFPRAGDDRITAPEP